MIKLLGKVCRKVVYAIVQNPVIHLVRVVIDAML